MDADKQKTRYWLALAHAPGIGSAKCQQLLQQFGDPETIFVQSRHDLLSAGLSSAIADAILQPDWKSIDDDLEWLAHPDHHLLTLACETYPALLRTIERPPPVLFVAGDVSLLQAPQLAIVGSRNPTSGGAKLASDFARHLARAGLVITSGMALGIDAAAHRGALGENQATIAVAGTGLDRVYPARHRELMEEIINNGALVSEFTIGTEPRPENFPRRNRIITGLSLGTLVVEAAVKSGSLISARHAMEQGREVFAIPGSIHNPMARGCHALIREGAKLVEQVGDILIELQEQLQIAIQFDTTNSQDEPANSLSTDDEDVEYKQLLQAIGFDPMAIDALVERTGLTANALSSMLLILELNGKIESLSGGRFVRTR